MQSSIQFFGFGRLYLPDCVPILLYIISILPPSPSFSLSRISTFVTFVFFLVSRVYGIDDSSCLAVFQAENRIRQDTTKQKEREDSANGGNTTGWLNTKEHSLGFKDL